MCALSFYGIVIYTINKKIENKRLKLILNIIMYTLLITILLSRIYLNVHFFTDVVMGSIFGYLVLKMFIEYDKIKNII